MANGRKSIYDAMYAPSPWEQLITDLPQQLLEAQKFKFQRDQFDRNEELKALQLLPAHERMAAMKLSKNKTLSAIGDAYGKKSQKIDALIDPVNMNFNDKSYTEKIDYYEDLLTNRNIAGDATYTNQIRNKIDKLKDESSSSIVTKYIADHPNQNLDHLAAINEFDPQEAIKDIKREPGGMTFSSASNLRNGLFNEQQMGMADHTETLKILDRYILGEMKREMGIEQTTLSKEDAKKYALTIKQNNPAWYDDSGVLKPEHQKDMKAELDRMIAEPASTKVLTQEEKDAAKREAVKKAAEKKRLEEERKLQEENIKRQNAESLNLAGMMGYEGTDADKAKEIAQYRGISKSDLRKQNAFSEIKRRDDLVKKYRKKLGEATPKRNMTKEERITILETGIIPESLK